MNKERVLVVDDEQLNLFIIEEFLAQEQERYRPQLERYALLARGLGPEPVRAALYFPLIGAFCVYD